MVEFVAQKYNVSYISNYFETKHGKGKHNGGGACIKNTLHRKEMNFMTKYPIQYEKYIVQWCSTIMEGITTRKEE